ncbi:hypothetical protein Q9R29_06575 [Rothia sp. ARF10]|nr:hypothetical protein [Rothia sp. ARF10]
MALPLVAGGLVSMWLLSRLALSGDALYVIGGTVTGAGAGHDPSELFLARPLVHRAYLGGLTTLVQSVGLDPAGQGGMLAIRAAGWLTAALACVVLWRGLSRHTGHLEAGWSAAAAFLALAFAPNWSALQPDWLAVVIAVGALGSSLLSHRLWGPAVGGVLLALALGSKIAAIPWVLLSLLVLALLARRRAVVAGVVALAASLLMFAVEQQVMPWEIQWLRDQVALVDESPLSTGMTPSSIAHGIKDTVDVAIINPVVWAAVPAVVVLVLRRGSTRRALLLSAGIAITALALAVGSGYGQFEHFSYHWVGLPVLAAGALAWALAEDPRGRTQLTVGGLVSGVLAVVATTRPVQWRETDTHILAMFFALGSVSVLASWRALAAHRASRTSPDSAVGAAAGAVLVAAVLVAPLVPGVPGSFAMYNAAGPVGRPIAAHTAELADLERIRPVLPADETVLYLTYGVTNAVLGNPATCRYPSPQWLQRAPRTPAVREMWSYRDNLTCLRPDPPAFVVWDTRWFPHRTMTPEVRSYLDGFFDCGPERRLVITQSRVWVCPRRIPGPG